MALDLLIDAGWIKTDSVDFKRNPSLILTAAKECFNAPDTDPRNWPQELMYAMEIPGGYRLFLEDGKLQFDKRVEPSQDNYISISLDPCINQWLRAGGCNMSFQRWLSNNSDDLMTAKQWADISEYAAGVAYNGNQNSVFFSALAINDKKGINDRSIASSEPLAGPTAAIETDVRPIVGTTDKKKAIPKKPVDVEMKDRAPTPKQEPIIKEEVPAVSNRSNAKEFKETNDQIDKERKKIEREAKKQSEKRTKAILQSRKEKFEAETKKEPSVEQPEVVEKKTTEGEKTFEIERKKEPSPEKIKIDDLPTVQKADIKLGPPHHEPINRGNAKEIHEEETTEKKAQKKQKTQEELQRAKRRKETEKRRKEKADAVKNGVPAGKKVRIVAPKRAADAAKIVATKKAKTQGKDFKKREATAPIKGDEKEGNKKRGERKDFKKRVAEKPVKIDQKQENKKR